MQIRPGLDRQLGRLWPQVKMNLRNIAMANHMTRRKFMLSGAALLAAGPRTLKGIDVEPQLKEPIIDIHQHTNYAGRSNEKFIAHQRAMGITRTILLPAGSLYGLAVKA